ncbi:hypothetical protein MLD38_012445 [Melastoma candidum]|uniref:Uncharacterized protein n=1 Tax=Melastoma candidum TaxID=119954 RepID=A0ACB9RES5_9MYRT|nr:hypothetical protein MLD38_012445 [Melastoma candidum]
MGNPHGKWPSKATKLETTIWAIRILLICLGIGSCIALKAAIIPYASSFVVDTIPCIWNYGRVLFSPPCIYIVANCIIMATTASTSFHHQNNLCRKADTAPPSLYSQRSRVLEMQFDDKGGGKLEEKPEVIKQMITDSGIALNTSEARVGCNSSDLPDNPSNTSGATPGDRTMEEESFETFLIQDVAGSINKGGAARKARSKAAVRNKEDCSGVVELQLKGEGNEKSKQEGSSTAFPESEDGELPETSAAEVDEGTDTLDSIWTEITGGHGKQPTLQPKKSDTWDKATRKALNEAKPGGGGKSLRKSETFRGRRKATVEVMKEKSMGQDELRLRIEAFIRKNRDYLRLQREESDLRVNSGITYG